MLNRDFSKSNKDYLRANRIGVTLFVGFIVIGLIVCAFFGMNGNFEFTGYYEFSVTVGTEVDSSEYSTYIDTISSRIDEIGGDYDSYYIYDEGDDTRLVIRYLSKLSDNEISQLNTTISTDLNIDEALLSTHSHVGSTIRAVDYLYCAIAIILLAVVSSVFARFRYNTASAFSIILACLLGTLTFMMLGAILRLEVGLSYFALLVILNALIVYLCVDLFENMRDTSWLEVNDYSSALNHGMTSSRFRQCVLSVAVMIVGILFVVFAPETLKYVSLNIMFIAVAVLFTMQFIVPFVWSMFITKFNTKVRKKVAVSESGEVKIKTEIKNIKSAGKNEIEIANEKDVELETTQTIENEKTENDSGDLEIKEEND